MMRRLGLAIAFLLWAGAALAQGTFSTQSYSSPTPPNGDSSNRNATTAFVQSAFAGGSSVALTANFILVGSAGNLAVGVPMSGDCTIVSAGTITCTKTNGVAFVASATTDTTNASNISSGTLNTLRLPSPFTSGTASGNTTKFMTGTGTFTLNHAATFDGNGNIQDGGAVTGTVTSVTCGTGLSGGTFTTSGTCAVSLTTASNVLGGDVALNNISNYFDGPSMAQGTSGTWFASGEVTVTDSASATVDCKLWDGTTVIASSATGLSAGFFQVVHLAGILASPAANIKISCKDQSNTTGNIKFNASGNSKDAAIYGFRIQ